ncbi:MAG: glycosyltransferase [Elusimicrobiota bacterium]|jgi:CDP-glycerol glycerophosphotransferase|nr:glycosyltransferase [Elusimicrobiota bacterium]
MTRDPLISVIVPVYNVEKYLSQCLENLIFQTYRNLEIIIVDDGSTDGSHLIYEKYASQDTRIKIIKQANRGLAASARNAGIKQAQGEYIHFMDSDDYIDLDYYEKMLKAAVDTQADMAGSGFRFFVDGGGVCDWSVISFSQNVILTNTNDKLYVYGFIHLTVWKYLFKTEFIKDRNLSFEAGIYGYGEDPMFTVTALYYSNKIVLVPKVSYYYRFRRAGSIMNLQDSQEAKKKDSDYIDMFNKVKEFARTHNFEIKVDNPNKDYVMSKYKLFSKLSLFRKKVYNDKIKYYILGGKVCILTVNTSEGKDKGEEENM